MRIRPINLSLPIGLMWRGLKETDHSATSERRRSLPDVLRRFADLLALAAHKYALNGRDLYLRAGLSILRKSQRIVFD